MIEVFVTFLENIKVAEIKFATDDDNKNSENTIQINRHIPLTF